MKKEKVGGEKTMKICGILLVVIFSVFLVHPAFSGNTDQGMDHSRHAGEKIHESNVEGYQFAYHLVDLKEKNSRHLMVYIIGPEGEKIDQAKVGFLVKRPDGSKQKLMATGMKGAFGVNVDFKVKGTYKIKMKVVTGGKKLFDEFVYEVK
jgi:hypothetical protein